MAKVQTETVVITFNKLVKDTQVEEPIVSSETMDALGQIAQELAGNNIIVEVGLA